MFGGGAHPTGGGTSGNGQRPAFVKFAPGDNGNMLLDVFFQRKSKEKDLNIEDNRGQ